MARILVIDDDNLVLAALTEILTEGGHQVISPKPGTDPAAAAFRADYDLLLTDIFLPRVSGWDLIQALRSQRPDLPVVAISGGGMAVEAGLALRISEVIGADFVLPKPVDSAVLLATVNRALKRRQPH